MSQAWFITGTDTGIGKTWCTLGLIEQFKQCGLRTVGMKPIATGCHESAAGLRNTDAKQILAASSFDLPYAQINPYAFLPPIAPHLAAAQVGRTITLAPIIEAYQQLVAHSDVVIVEGVGGWRVPLNATETLKDLVLALQIPVILVVGLRLGCLNHALLSAEAIVQDGCHLAGWVANALQPDWAEEQAVIDTLVERLTAPLLGHVPYLAQWEQGLFESFSHGINTLLPALSFKQGH